ncbi:ornithine cyclodeaminase family protein [Ruegeria sp. EL01]|jgi:ornithine cyclodeaminase|uniref:ornithine cyclodeaminase family protein n=1 Tax=Ruegeria sp. EL01 TaxID=2107578 RepID=UPI000EA8313C|nr:ornithine cyclodeaminase family protein [Ruegeria sp. EL01]
MTVVYTRSEIEAVLPEVDVVEEIARGFVAFSRGDVEVPPVGELLFPECAGELHIKYGSIRGDDVCVIKVATGFYNNPKIGLPPFGGCMIAVSQKTGLIDSVLLEEGELTNHRTAAAGAVVARTLAPATPRTIGIVGCGTQARLQADYLRRVTDCRDLTIWAREGAQIERAVSDVMAMGYQVTVSQTLDELCDRSRLIVTTTPSEQPLLKAPMIRPGTHITAIGADTPEKTEIAPEILALADVVIADSLTQCELRGEIWQALRAGVLHKGKAVELGNVISGQSSGRENEDQITVADLTGVAVQDIAIAKAVLRQLASG